MNEWSIVSRTSLQNYIVSDSVEMLLANAPRYVIQFLESPIHIDYHSTIAYEGFPLRIPLAHVPSTAKGIGESRWRSIVSFTANFKVGHFPLGHVVLRLPQASLLSEGLTIRWRGRTS